MTLSAFDNKARKPKPADLQKVLGRSGAHWVALIKHLAAEYRPLEQRWDYSGSSWGWTLRLKQRRRTVLYLTPCRRHFLVGVVLGERAVLAAHKADLPEPLLEAIDEAPRYAEGRGIRIEVRTRKDLENTKLLAAVKMAN